MEACNITLSGSTNEIQVNNKQPSNELRTSSYEVLLNSVLKSGDSRYTARKTRHVLSFFFKPHAATILVL